MGNRSKRGRPDPDAPDPVTELQEEARWSAYTRHIRWPFTPGTRRGAGGSRLRAPTAAEWIGTFVVGAVVVVALFGVFWLISKILP
jgi:hypothetical protein